MSDPTLASLDARLAVVEQRLGITPTPDPVPDPPPPPPPAPGPQLPAAPTGLRAATLADGRIQLDWDPASGVDSWTVLDLLDAVTPIKDTVIVARSIRSPLKAGSRRRYAVQARNAAGVSPLSAPLDLPPAVPPAPPPAASYPADICGKNWYLTLPIPRASDGLATEIHQPALATYSSKYFELTPTGSEPGMVFRAWHGGATTVGSKNPRSELREENGAAHAAWSSNTGRHRMVVQGQVNRLTKVKPDVVIAQIHDATDDVTVFRVEGSNLWITAGNEPHGYLVDSNFALGRRYEIGFDVSGGVVSYLYSGRVVPYTLSAKTEGNYFKTGNYLQSNPTTAPSESTSEFSEVVIYSVAVTHS